VIRRSRLFGLLFFVCLVGTIQVLEHLYRWYQYREERLQLVVLREELVDLGAEMIEAQLEAGRIRAELEELDRLLDHRRSKLDGYEAHARNGALPRERYTAYRRDLDAFNASIRQRNEQLNELNETVMRRTSAAVRYTVLADSLRTLAARAREPYFAIPLPAEAAIERGISTVLEVGPPESPPESRPVSGVSLQHLQPARE
jgi:hypothetical protein